MGRKWIKVSVEDKLEIAIAVCDGRVSVSEASKRYGLVESKVRYLYKIHGSSVFTDNGTNNIYPPEVKLKAVTEYLDCHGGLTTIAAKYGLSSVEQLRKWVNLMLFTHIWAFTIKNISNL